MPPFCKLADVSAYTPGDWDLVADPLGREAWLQIFANHTDSLIEHARSSDQPPPDAALRAYSAAFHGVLEHIRAEPGAHAPLTIYRLCKIRHETMMAHGLGDPYDRVKREENERALALLPDMLAAVDACRVSERVEMLVRGVLAGNKFDLGAKDTMDEHAAGGIDFHATLAGLGPRPWFRDDLDQIAARLALLPSTGKRNDGGMEPLTPCVTEPLAPDGLIYRKAMYFVDNAGGDIVLGVLPFARYLADQGCSVVLAANDVFSLNDITVTELAALLDQVRSLDARFAAHLDRGAITIVGTGCDCPLIDLSDVSPACNDAAEDCDLVILEGMGRAVESNFNVPLTCDAIRIAMIKNRSLATYLDCQLFDLVATFTAAAKS